MIPIQARLTTATFVLAQQCARNAVKEELKRQRRRLADVEPKEITPFGAWFITRVVIGMVGILSVVPFVMYFWKNG